MNVPFQKEPLLISAEAAKENYASRSERHLDVSFLVEGSRFEALKE